MSIRGMALVLTPTERDAGRSVHLRRRVGPLKGRRPTGCVCGIKSQHDDLNCMRTGDG